MKLSKNYVPANVLDWTGRVDDPLDSDSFRWHQIIKPIDLNANQSDKLEGFCFLGFCSDEGVIRNKGRKGTAQGPKSIRTELSNLPYGFSGKPKLFDAGNIFPQEGKLEDAQKQLAQAVYIIKSLNLFSIVLGGGHEIAYGHFNGLKKFFNYPPGIFNMDAHFDLRPYKTGTSSGSMFMQISDDCMNDSLPFQYFVTGIQTYANTVGLFNKAKELKANYILAKDISEKNLVDIFEKIDAFTAKQKHIYLSFCTDVISSAYAPGVSATQPFGLEPEITLKIVKHILRSGKVEGFDFAEVSPRFDDDHQTAKLVAVMIYAMINTLSNSE